ncbi:hypothetical protein CL630_02215 [bacterium]|nr:hypothetical protein [bacterium]|tara:strand:+ start:8119 stop:8838 length:720 start_codon:yes stop_codon:yes gene_type:complete
MTAKEKKELLIPVLYYLFPYILQLFAWFPTRAAFEFFLRFDVRGLKNIKRLDRRKGVIFVANHADELDPIILRAALSPFSRLAPMFYAADEPRFFKKKFGWRSFLYSSGIFFKLWGAYSVYTGLHDFEKSLINHVRLLQRGRLLAYFPEGGIPRDGQMRKGKPGIGYLAHKTGAVVVPVGICGTFQISSHSFFSRQNTVRVVFGKPQHYASAYADLATLSTDDYQRISDNIMKDIEKLM